MFYCLGRGGVLGDVDAATVAERSSLVQAAPRRDVVGRGPCGRGPHDRRGRLPRRRARLRATYVQDDRLARHVRRGRGERVVDAAPAGRWPLVDGYRRFALPDDVVARAFQLVIVLRELRGGAYGEAVTALGITPAESHYLNSADAFELYGYESDDAPVVTDELVERRALAEDRATELLVPTYDALDDDGRLAFLDGVRALAATADVDVEGVAD